MARVAVGLTQARLARLAGVTQSVVSEVENGSLAAGLEVRCRLAAACGHELAWRFYPVATVSLRDSGQMALAQAIATMAHPSWTARLEVPVAPADPRAADLVLSNAAEVLHIEIERALVDAQAQIRAAQLKRGALAERESRPIRLVLAVPDTRSTRERLAPSAALIARAFPIPSRRAWQAIRNGGPMGADAILLVRPARLAAPQHAAAQKAN